MKMRTTLHYVLLIAIAIVCAFPFLWTLAIAIGTEGNVFDFPSSFVPQRPSLASVLPKLNGFISSGIPMWPEKFVPTAETPIERRPRLAA